MYSFNSFSAPNTSLRVYTHVFLPFSTFLFWALPFFVCRLRRKKLVVSVNAPSTEDTSSADYRYCMSNGLHVQSLLSVFTFKFPLYVIVVIIIINIIINIIIIIIIIF